MPRVDDLDCGGGYQHLNRRSRLGAGNNAAAPPPCGVVYPAGVGPLAAYAVAARNGLRHAPRIDRTSHRHVRVGGENCADRLGRQPATGHTENLYADHERPSRSPVGRRDGLDGTDHRRRVGFRLDVRLSDAEPVETSLGEGAHDLGNLAALRFGCLGVLSNERR